VAAKQEGKVSVFSTTGVGYRKWMETFEAAFPGVIVEHQQLPSSDLLVPRILEERKAGIYEWDVLITASTIALPRLRPQGVLDPLKPLLFRPDVLDDKAWNGGFDAGWLDNTKNLGYAISETVLLMAVNSDLVREGEIKTVRDLLDPKWKGKAIYQDVRSGLTFAVMTAVRVGQGEEMLRRLIVDQEPAFSRDVRQIVESMVRGRYAFSNSVTKPVLQQFLDEGQGRNIRLIDISDMSYITNANALWVVNRAPHPNAARLLANWIPTRAGQEAFSKFVESNSRRSDIPPHDPLAMPKPGQRYLRVGPEDTLPELDKTQALLNEWVGIRN